MVAPLLFGLGLAGLAAGGAAGRSFLDDYMSRRQNEEQAGGFLQALDQARVGTGVEQARDPGDPYGPQPEQEGYDMGLLGEALLRQGNPAGFQMALQPQQQAQEAAAGELGFLRQMQLQQQKDAAAMARQRQQQQADIEAANLKAQGQMPPWMILPNTTQGQALIAQNQQLSRFGENLARLRDFAAMGPRFDASAHGTEVQAIRGEMMSLLSALEGQGVIREGERDLWESRVPDVNSFTGSITGSTTGGIQALTDLYNAQREGMQWNAQFAAPGMLRPLPAFPSRLTPPPGTRPVPEGAIEQDENIIRKPGRLEAGGRTGPGASSRWDRGEAERQRQAVEGAREGMPPGGRQSVTISIPELLDMTDEQIEQMARQ